MPALKEKVRLSLDVTEELNRTLESLAARSGNTKSELLRKAIALMVIAVQAKEKGQKLGVAREGQTLETEIVGL